MTQSAHIFDLSTPSNDSSVVSANCYVRTPTTLQRDGNPRFRIVAMVGLVVLTSLTGCTVCLNAKRTMIDEPSRFSWQTDRKRSVEVYRAWADQAWGVACSSNPDPSVSEPYEVGFKDGFVDYVYAGGNGEPPPVAPREYWNVGQRNPHGQAAAAEWFAGYRLGSQVAHEEGYRERALAPTQALLLGPRDNNDYTTETPVHSQPTPNWSQAEPIPHGSLKQRAASEAHEPSLKVPEQAIEVPSSDNLPTPSDAAESADRFLKAVPEVDSPEIEVPEAPLIEVPPAATDVLPADPTPTNDTNPSNDVDDIFGPPTAFQSTSIRNAKKRNMTQVSSSQEDLSSAQARAAFAAAIRTNLTKVSTGSAAFNNPMNHPQRTQQSRQQALSPQAAIPAKHQTAIVPASASTGPQPQAIPRSEDQAAAMFHRLSQ